MRPDNAQLKQKINSFIKKAKEDGTYDQIRAEHLQNKIEEFEKYGLDFFF
jgi:polar amino acid transport system substrate-binding protein